MSLTDYVIDILLIAVLFRQLRRSHAQQGRHPQPPSDAEVPLPSEAASA